MAKNKEKKVKKNKEAKASKQSNKVDSKKKETKAPAVVNIFTAVGLEPKHRAVPFQLTRYYDEVTVARNKEQFPYEAEINKPSLSIAVLVQDNEATFWSITGNKFQNLEVMGKAFTPKTDGVYMCEIYVDEDVMTLDKFKALFSPFRKNKLTAPQQAIMDDKAQLVITDYITTKEFSDGSSETPYSGRTKFIAKSVKKLVKGKKSRFHLPKTIPCENIGDLRLLASENEHGINIRGADNRYVCGHQNFHYLLMKKPVTANLTCVGFEEGSGKTEGMVDSLLFKYQNDTEIKAPLGSDYSEEDSIKMLKVLKSDGKDKKKKAKKGKKVKTASSPLGYVWEVNALEVSNKGVMKLPTVGNFTTAKADY